jgi:hypothetical protein
MPEPWHISDAALTRATSARVRRPKPAGGFRVLSNIFVGLMLPISMALLASDYPGLGAFMTVAGLGWIVLQLARGRDWRKRFEVRTRGPRLHVTVPGAERQPELTYSMMRANLDHQRLLVDFHLPDGFQIEPGRPALLVPAFDAHLGVEGPRAVRGLLGSALCAHLVQWHQEDGVIVRDGMLVVPMEAFERTRQYVALYGAFVDRLHDLPQGLASLAREDTPLHAARAWSLLAQMQPDTAVALLQAPDLSAQNRAIGQAIVDGEHPLDMAFDWPVRAVIFRGVIGVATPAQRPTLLSPLTRFDPSDEMDVLGWADMLDAARTRQTRWPEGDPAWARMTAWLETHGDQTALAWLTERMTRPRWRKQGKQLAGRIKARLYAERSGRLALEPDARTGALSDAQAGEVSFAAEQADDP